MQKIYAIYATVELIDYPAWLRVFQQKYDRQHPLHITLKQLAYIEQMDFVQIQKTLESILAQHKLTRNDLHVGFDTLMPCEHDADDEKGYIYVNATVRNNKLDELQKDIREQLAGYSNYYFRDSYAYEYEFNPHITIASGLEPNQYTRALQELEARAINFTGIVTTVTISLVDNVTLSEANDPNNLTSYDVTTG